MSKQVDFDMLRGLSTENETFKTLEDEVIGGIHREEEGRKAKLESARMSREKRAKRKRQRQAAAM